MIGTETVDDGLGNESVMDVKYRILCENGQRGLYAMKSYLQGQVILDLPTKTQPNPDKFSIEALPGVHIDCSDSFVGAINHNCKPNAAVRNGRIVAWACIKPGDEITIDYKRTESKLAEPFDCQCGHQLCLGRVE